MLILVRKIYHGIINIVSQHSDRGGVTCLRPLGSSKYSNIKTMRYLLFTSTVAALYNVLPSKIKSILTITKCKTALDSFMQSFPDIPPTPEYIGRMEILSWSGLVVGVSNCYQHSARIMAAATLMILVWAIQHEADQGTQDKHPFL